MLSHSHKADVTVIWSLFEGDRQITKTPYRKQCCLKGKGHCVAQTWLEYIVRNDQWHVPQSYLNAMVIVSGTSTYCRHCKCRHL